MTARVRRRRPCGRWLAALVGLPVPRHAARRKASATSAEPVRRRQDLDHALVRVVTPTAEELTSRQRAIGIEAGADLDELASITAHQEQARWNGRRSGESDAALGFRRRHHDALGFARWLVVELEALAPVACAEDAPVDEVDQRALRDAIAAAEVARHRWTTGGRRDDAPRRIDAVRRALEWARTWRAESCAGKSTIDVMTDAIVASAVRDAPELGAISVAEWQTAIDTWPGLRGRGGAPGRGSWARVVFSLLKPHGLTDARDARSLAKGYDAAPSKRTRPPRRK